MSSFEGNNMYPNIAQRNTQMNLNNTHVPPPIQVQQVQHHNHNRAQPIVAQVAPSIEYPEPTTYEFKYPLCSCCDDVPVCCMSLWCPCIQVGKNAAIRRNESRSKWNNTECLTHCGFIVLGALTHSGPLCSGAHLYTQRQKNRKTLGIHAEESKCEDALFSIFCSVCVLTQESRQLLEYQAVQDALRGVGPPHQRMEAMPMQAMPISSNTNNTSRSNSHQDVSHTPMLHDYN